MRLDHDRTTRPGLVRGILVLVALATLLYSVMGAVVRPAIFSDSAFGFRVWDSMRQGAGFNRMANVDPADIASDITYFKAAWTPGQYLLPGALELLGLDLGLAVVAVVALFSAIGLVGWHALYRAFGFPPLTCAVALLLIAGGRQFTLPFGIYNGGEVLLFGAAPWAFLLVWRLRDLRWRSVLPLLAATAGVVFLKLSGIIFMGAAIAAVVPAAGQPLLGRDTLRRAAVAAVTLLLAGAALRCTWLSQGWSAVQEATRTDWSLLGPAIAFAISGTWACIFSFGSLAQFVFMFPGRALLTTMTPVDVLLLGPAVATAAFVWLRLRRDYGDYVRFASIATAAVVVFFILLLLRGGMINWDERHFRPIALLLTVGLVEAFMGARSRIAHGVFALLAGIAVAYGVMSFARQVQTNLDAPLGARGVRLRSVSAPVLDFLRTVDVPDGTGDRPLVLVPSPEIALELRNARILTTHADFELPEELATQVRHGRVRRIHVLLTRSMERNGKADIILRTFAGYPREDWRITRLGDFVIFSSTPGHT